MITGISGVALADLVLAGLKLHSKFAQGAALGSAAHGFGTSKAFMLLLGPSLIHAVIWLLG